MAKTKVSEWSSTASSNTDIDGINIAEGCAPSGINNAIREMMSQVKDLYSGVSGDALAIAGGGTGATTADNALTNLGGTTVGKAVFKATDEAAARTAIGVVIGTDVQAYDAQLSTLAGSSADRATFLASANDFTFRNRIINGDMRIDQRNAGASVTYAAQGYVVDRFSVEKQNLSTLVATAQQVSDAPSGFVYSLKTTVTTAEASGASSSFVGSDQRIEGFNFADMSFGTASAQSFTLSFWVKSSVTGTYPVSFFNASVNRAYLATYSVSSANTWEYKTITVAGDTSGTWNTTNGIGLGVQFGLGGGSNNEGTAGAWGSTYKSRTSACVNLNATLNATWQITGVQLEAGSVATPFERRPYGTELALCQRYFYRSGGSFAFQSHALGTFTSTQTVDAPFTYPVPFRATPSLTVNNLASFITTIGGVPSSIVLQDAPSTNNNQLMLRIQVPTASTVGYSARLYSNNNAAATLDFSAEL